MTVVCVHCHEPILDRHVQVNTYMGGQRAHRECSLRAVAGGVNHQRGTCSCCGGPNDPDPPELTRREAAIAAAYYFEAADDARRS